MRLPPGAEQNMSAVKPAAYPPLPPNMYESTVLGGFGVRYCEKNEQRIYSQSVLTSITISDIKRPNDILYITCETLLFVRSVTRL